MTLISAMGRRRVEGFSNSTTEGQLSLRMMRHYQILSPPVTDRLLALQSTVK